MTRSAREEALKAAYDEGIAAVAEGAPGAHAAHVLDHVRHSGRLLIVDNLLRDYLYRGWYFPDRGIGLGGGSGTLGAVTLNRSVAVRQCISFTRARLDAGSGASELAARSWAASAVRLFFVRLPR